ncbi:MAG: hypothetical protein ACRD9R_15490, partial [Pyrinomonadaceae bacterium]
MSQFENTHQLPSAAVRAFRAALDYRRAAFVSLLLFLVGVGGKVQTFAQTGTVTASPAPSAPMAQPAAPRRRDVVISRGAVTSRQAEPAGAAAMPVLAVMHRLRGWKLRALLTPPDAPFAPTFDDKFVRTHIVAGYLMPDGRSVMARLPQAEAEMLNFSSEFRRMGTAPSSFDEELLVVRRDGEQFKAEFVGVDGITGLSLLEATGSVLLPAPTSVARVAAYSQPLRSGQRVRLIAPVSADSALQSVPPKAEDAPVGDEGVLYMDLSEASGQLKEIQRSPSGRPARFTVQLEKATPEWAGGVAFNEAGELVGIVEQSGEREMSLLPAAVVRGAAARIQARRASVPQPWLGARGDAVARTSLELFVRRGWPRDAALEMLNRQRGVLLT